MTIAIVTGANKGLGFSIVQGLCEKFHGKVYLTSRDEARGKIACEKLSKLGYTPKYYQLDVSDYESISRFVSHLRCQNEQIEIVVNNAAILFLKDATEPKIYQAEQTMLINFFSLVDFCEAIIPLMSNGGKIVNISSSSGHLCRIPSEVLRKKISADNLSLNELKILMNNYIEAVRSKQDLAESWGDSPYVVSKVGVNAYTFILHRKLQEKGVIVNSVHPGYVMSDMTKGAGSVTPDEAANVPLQLALKATTGGQYIWHNGASVPWGGPDPRGYIDGNKI